MVPNSNRDVVSAKNGDESIDLTLRGTRALVVQGATDSTIWPTGEHMPVQVVGGLFERNPTTMSRRMPANRSVEGSSIAIDDVGTMFAKVGHLCIGLGPVAQCLMERAGTAPPDGSEVC